MPPSDAVYQARLGEIAGQIVEDLHAPDILLVQEAEDQDICAVAGASSSAARPTTGTASRTRCRSSRSGSEADHGIAYDAAYDRDGSDDRGIVSGFLYRTDRVELLPAGADHPVLGSEPEIAYPAGARLHHAGLEPEGAERRPAGRHVSARRDGKEVYTRDPQVGYFRIWRTAIGRGLDRPVRDLRALLEHARQPRRGQRRSRRATALIVKALAGAPAGSRGLGRG